MVKKQTVKPSTSRRRATSSSARSSSTTKKSPSKVAKTPIKTHRYDEKRPSKEDQPKYQHYGYYQPPAPTGFTISRRQAKTEKPNQPVKRRTRAEVLIRRRIAVTVVVCLLVIFGVIAAKILVGNEPRVITGVNGVNPARDIEEQPKSEVDIKKGKSEQDFKIIGAILSESSFSADSVVKLKVPIYKQTYQQSCEAASLRMALKYRGIETTDLDVLKLMKYDDQPAKKVDGGWTWGNPHEMFVGDKDGDQTKMTGYGVFAEPIASASEQLGRPATVQNDVKPEWLAQQIYAGNPVVLWGVSTKISEAKWKTPSGDEITAPIRTHTRLVIGVKGDPKNPTGFYLNDPAGKEIYWTTAQLNTNVAAGVGQGVAVY